MDHDRDASERNTPSQWRSFTSAWGQAYDAEFARARTRGLSPRWARYVARVKASHEATRVSGIVYPEYAERTTTS